MIENNKANIQWGSRYITAELIENQPDVVIKDKEQRTTVAFNNIDVAVPNDHDIQWKVSKKLEQYQRLNKEIEKIWKVKTKTVPLV